MSMERKNLSSAATPERQTDQNICANSTTAYPACQVENLPNMLRESGLFCCWKAEPDGKTGRLTKKPCNPRTGGGASSKDPGTFAPLKTALARLQTGGYSGLGVGLFGRLGAIDLDHCYQDGKWSALANDIVQTMDAYTEVSPSGQGIRILFTVPEGFQYDTDRYFIMNPKRGLEVYIAGVTQKFVTVTGNVLRANDLLERGEQIQAVLEKYMQRPSSDVSQDADRDPPEVHHPLSDTVLVDKACQSDPGFQSLWKGHPGKLASPSEADLALCSKLAFWTGRDAQQMDRLFRQSGLMREKWDSPRECSTYGADTIQAAIRGCQETYNPDYYGTRTSESRESAEKVEEPAVPVGREAKPASSFQDTQTRFLWYPYLPIGDYSVIMADGGVGKTILCCGIAAAISTGQKLPGETQPQPPQNVLLVSAEDSGEVLKQRLAHSKADLDRVFLLDYQDSLGMNFSDRCAEFEATVQKYHPGLVIVDPWHAFLGPDININRVNAVRPVFQKLSSMAKRCACAFILVSHVNKRAQGENANHAATGSSDFINASRSAIRIVFDESSPNSRILVHTKANYAACGRSIRYRIEHDGLIWDGFSSMTKQTLEAAARRHMAPSEIVLENQAHDTFRQTLIQALQEVADPLKPSRISYQAFKDTHGETIFGDQQPKRALDMVKESLHQLGYDLTTGVRVKYNGQTRNGFQIQVIQTKKLE